MYQFVRNPLELRELLQELSASGKPGECSATRSLWRVYIVNTVTGSIDEELVLAGGEEKAKMKALESWRQYRGADPHEPAIDVDDVDFLIERVGNVRG